MLHPISAESPPLLNLRPGGRPEDFQAVVTAFEVLTDSQRRDEYDRLDLRWLATVSTLLCRNCLASCRHADVRDCGES